MKRLSRSDSSMMVAERLNRARSSPRSGRAKRGNAAGGETLPLPHSAAVRDASPPPAIAA
jgi:hypothetical protein